LLDHVGENELLLVLPLLESADVRVVAAPLDLVEDDQPWWWTHFDSLVVPPLSSDAAQSLASRLLAGLGHPRNDALALAIGQASAGIPRLVHLLVDRVHIDPTRTEPGRIPELLHELVAERGDPSGLRWRIEQLQARHFSALERRALDGAADAPAGDLSPDELRAALVDDEVTPTQARHTIQSLLDQGWLVERDDRISLEHPVLQEHWKATRRHPENDIPF
jgi:hypothetical protein